MAFSILLFLISSYRFSFEVLKFDVLKISAPIIQCVVVDAVLTIHVRDIYPRLSIFESFDDLSFWELRFILFFSSQFSSRKVGGFGWQHLLLYAKKNCNESFLE